MKIKLLVLAALDCLASVAIGAEQTVRMQADAETGGLSEIVIAGDKTGMNWTQRCDGKEFAWATPEYRWGTGLSGERDAVDVDHAVGRGVRRSRAGCSVIIRTDPTPTRRIRSWISSWIMSKD